MTNRSHRYCGIWSCTPKSHEGRWGRGKTLINYIRPGETNKPQQFTKATYVCMYNLAGGIACSHIRKCGVSMLELNTWPTKGMKLRKNTSKLKALKRSGGSRRFLFFLFFKFNSRRVFGYLNCGFCVGVSDLPYLFY